MFFIGLLLFLVYCLVAVSASLRLFPLACVRQEDAGSLQSVQTLTFADYAKDRSLLFATGPPDVVLQWRLSALRSAAVCAGFPALGCSVFCSFTGR
jgi:hypothetical protein